MIFENGGIWHDGWLQDSTQLSATAMMNVPTVESTVALK